VKTSDIILFMVGCFSVFACQNEQKKELSNKAIVKIKTSIPNDSIRSIDKPMYKKVKSMRSNKFIAKEILITSDRYKQITKGLNVAVVKNGGEGYGVRLERSPNPEKDGEIGYSKTYDFVVYEKYPERQLNIAWFSFNPISEKLFEYDPILDHKKAIAFDKNLLEKLELPKNK
jgi:hypothetical protein